MFDFNSDLANRALTLTGSKYQVPENYGAGLGSVSEKLQAPMEQQAPAAQPVVEEKPDFIQQAQSMVGSAGAVANSAGGEEDQGKKNQQQAMNKIGSVLGAIGNFYSGNYAGMANSISSIGGTTEQQQARKAKEGSSSGALGMIGGLFGG